MRKNYILQAVPLAGDHLPLESAFIVATNNPGSFYYTTINNATIMDKDRMRQFLKENPQEMFIKHIIVASKINCIHLRGQNQAKRKE